MLETLAGKIGAVRDEDSYLEKPSSPALKRKFRLAIISTHPIQYHAVWFRALSSNPEIDLQVWYCHRASPKEQAAAGFGVEFDWDIPLLEGYSHGFLQNVARNPTVNSFNGLDTPALRQIIQAAGYGAVLINGWHYKSAWQAMRACWKTGTPVMVRSDSHLRTERSVLRRALKWPLYKWFIGRLDACLPAGTWSRDYFLHYGASEGRVFVVPHIVDGDRLSSQAEAIHSQRNELRSNWELSPDLIVFLFVGKFIHKKRPFDFLKALEIGKQTNTRIAGLMVGDGPLKNACEQFAKEHALPVSFTGFLNQSAIAQAFVAADALVLPSDGGETWGLVVNEAISCGLPCFVSDHVGSGPDIIENNQAGAVFPLGNPKTLASLLVRFASDEKLRSEMRVQALMMSRKYSVESAVQGTLRALESVCGSL